MEMGFTREQALHALAIHTSVSDAAEFLLTTGVEQRQTSSMPVDEASARAEVSVEEGLTELLVKFLVHFSAKYRNNRRRRWRRVVECDGR